MDDFGSWIARIVVAALLGLLIGLTYSKIFRDYHYSGSFVHTCVLTVVLCSLISGIVADAALRSGQALAFALVGMLGLIRFRTVVRDTREFTYLFIAIVAGVAIGSGNIALGVLGSAFSLGLIFLLEWGGIGAPRTSMMRVRIKTPPGEMDRVSSQLAALSRKADLTTVQREEDGSYSLSYDVWFPVDLGIAGIVDSLKNAAGIDDIMITKSDPQPRRDRG